MNTDRVSRFGSTLIVFGALMFIGGQIYNIIDEASNVVGNPENYYSLISAAYGGIWIAVIIIGFIIWLLVLIMDIKAKRRTNE